MVLCSNFCVICQILKNISWNSVQHCIQTYFYFSEMPKKKAKQENPVEEKPSSDATTSLSKGKVRSVTMVTSNTKKSNESLRGRGKTRSKSGTFEPRLSEIPTKGSLLLDWVRRRMSYLSDDDQESSEEEEIQETTKDKKKKPHQPVSEDKEEKKAKPTAQAPKKGKKGKFDFEEKIIKLPRPSGLEDVVTLLIKARKEAQRLAEEQARLEAEGSAEVIEEILQKEEDLKKEKSKGKIIPAEPVKVPKEKAAEMQRKKDEEEKEALQKKQMKIQKEQKNRIDGLKSTLDIIRSIKDHSRKMRQRDKNDKYLLNVLDDFIHNNPPKSLSRLENYKWLRDSFRVQLREMMEKMTFRLLKDVDKNMNHIDLYIGDFNYKDDNFTLCLWLKFKMPTPLPNPRKGAPPPISLKIEYLKMSLDFPPSITGEGMVIRIMYLAYDHLSDTCKGSSIPAKPDYYNYDLETVMEKEWRVMKKYMVVGRYRAQYEQELQRHETNMTDKANYRPFSMAPPPPDLPPLSKFQPPEIDENGEIPEVPFTKLDPTPEEYAEVQEECEYKVMRQHLPYTPEEHEINLRKYIILGGLYIVNLFEQPPQPQHLVTIVLSVARFILPKVLIEVPFYEEFKTLPTTGEQKTPEELESALNLQEEGFARLISITITLPTHVMYLEPPLVCMWEEKQKRWSTKDIQDVKHNEEKGTVSFRVGRFGILGMATFRYGNLPFQTWDLRPDEDNNIIFQLTAAVLMFEFKIKDFMVTVVQFQNGPNNAMQDIVSKTFSIDKLAKILREGGVDIFPDYDAFCYVEGSCEKHWANEYMCYYNMAQLSICYNFAWSRWNATEGYRSIVMQMRIYNPELHTQKPHSLVLVTPNRASFINCAEVTPIFCRDPVEGSKFCCNLWYLMKATSTIYVRNKITTISQETVDTVANLLIKTRILSFS
ncbi:dynein axonemal intermediate chain 7-like isoform X2 [Harmonia axyridis]|uniref:dynein axonemal intermediate chain 7-like isoform X2 n=1 Tax=Harmonia axyridis TaxID=115357 RepID=UPI001E277188|nr:dynein axonemal intermediate chain 7-like isoform X2 [Harmonia axyridis]